MNICGEEMNYLAGFLEADGCVSVTNKHTRYPMLTIQVSQCRSIEPLKLFVDAFGGNIYEDIHKSKITKAKHTYKWVITGNLALVTLDKIITFCKFRNKEFLEKKEYYLTHRIGDKRKGRHVINQRVEI